MRAFLVAVIAILLAFSTYHWLERLGKRAWPAVVSRALAWAAIGMLVLNLSWPRAPGAQQPIVLLDASLSMGQDTAQWLRARALADSLGEVRWVGNRGASSDTLPNGAGSRLAASVAAAAAHGRPVVVVTDGEVEDAGEIPADLLRGLQVEVVPRSGRNDWAMVGVSGPARITVGDTLRLEATVRRVGSPAGDSIALELTGPGGRVMGRRTVRVADGMTTAALRFPSHGLVAGEHMLALQVAGGQDDEGRNDRRWHRLVVAATPGVVLVASPADWDARFLFRTLSDVSALPVRGFVQLGGAWRTMGAMLPASDETVRRAMRGADLLVLKGRAVERAGEARGRGLWLWPAGTGQVAESGDWYLTAAPVSPLAAALSTLPLDSFPPAVQLTSLQPPAGGWVALMAQAGRRGAPRPAMTGVETGRRRTVTTAVDGLWRWGFRGGSQEQGYRALVAATVSWLLASPDSARGKAAPVQHVVQHGRPVVFAWADAGAPQTLGITWASADSTRADSLVFDGAGRAQAHLAVGTWRYRLEDGATGLVAVEAYSDELQPRPITLPAQSGTVLAAPVRTAARDWWWLFLLAVAALCAEWVVRRRMGLR